jgi:hypothetical protein
MDRTTANLFRSNDFSLSVLLFLLVVLIFVFLPLRAIGILSGALLELFFSLLLISGVMSVTRQRAVPVAMSVLALTALLVGWLGFLYPLLVITVVKSALMIVFLSSLVVIVLIEVFRDGRITTQRIQGAVAAYLLIGMVWAICYRLIELLKPDAFQHGSGVVVGAASSIVTRECLFFSFGSLTTVSYGGMIAVHPLPWSLVMLEALIGQLFPAILLARLVSMVDGPRNQGLG